MIFTPNLLHIRTQPLAEATLHDDVWYAAVAVPQAFQVPPATTAYVLTSQNAALRLGEVGAPIRPVYAVGKATARVAEEQGLPVVLVGHGNAQDLATDILHQHVPPQTFCHVHGAGAALDFHSVLEGAGYSIVPVVGYQLQFMADIPPSFHTAEVCVVYAASLAQWLCEMYQLAPLTAKIWVCWSQTVALPLLEKGVPEAHIKILHKPDAQALETVLSCLHGSKTELQKNDTNRCTGRKTCGSKTGKTGTTAEW